VRAVVCRDEQGKLIEELKFSEHINHPPIRPHTQADVPRHEVTE